MSDDSASSSKPRRPKYGGRKKGTPNKATREAALRTQEAVKNGLTPLEFLISIMRNEPGVDKDGNPNPPYTLEQRMDAAKSAAPYIHPKLQSITHIGEGGGPIQFQQVKRVIVRA